MKHLFICFLTICIFVACNQNKPAEQAKPEWLLDEKTMVDIIVDMRIADAATYINTGAPPRDKLKDRAFIMKKYHIADSVFMKSHDYYTGHPEMINRIYEKVVDRLSEMEAENQQGQ